MDFLDHKVRLKKTVMFKRFLLANMHKPRHRRMESTPYYLIRLPTSEEVIAVQPTDNQSAESHLVDEIVLELSSLASNQDVQQRSLTIYSNFTCSYQGSKTLKKLVDEYKNIQLELAVATVDYCYRKSCNECCLAFNNDPDVLAGNTLKLKELMQEEQVKIQAFTFEDWVNLVDLINDCETLTGSGQVEEFTEEKYIEQFSPDKAEVHGKPAVRKMEDENVMEDLNFIASTKRKKLREYLENLPDDSTLVNRASINSQPAVRRNLLSQLESNEKQKTLDIFIRSGLHGAEWPTIAHCVFRLPMTGKVCVMKNEPGEQHVEERVIEKLEEDYIQVWEEEEETPIKLVIYMNFSTCHDCVEKFLSFTEKNKLHVEIVAAALYNCARKSCSPCNFVVRQKDDYQYQRNTEALKQLAEAGIKLRGFEWNDWSNLVALLNEPSDIPGSASYDYKTYTRHKYGLAHPRNWECQKKSYTRYEEDMHARKDFEYYAS